MNWLARLKKTQAAPQTDATNATKPGFVAFVASIPAPIQKIECVSAAANDPAQAIGLVANTPIATETPVSIEPPKDPNAWRELATAYNLHHFKCSTCIAAGRGAQYGLRCGVGAALWASYQDPEGTT